VPHPMPGTDEFTEASRKRKIDAVGKTSVKHARVPGKRKWDSAKVVVLQGKAGLK
jgi:hypothetical protein